MEYEAGLQRMRQLEEWIATLPPGNVVYKTIKGKEQPYLQWTEDGKQQTKYIKIAMREETLAAVAQRMQYEKELKELREQMERIPLKNRKMTCRTRVIYGEALNRTVRQIEGLKTRYCYRWLEKFLQSEMHGRICVLYGLRRTGKTTLLFQAISNLSDEERARAVYIKARSADTMSDFYDDLQELADRGYRYAFIDEVTLLEDFIDSASVFSDIFAMQGLKIVLSGTDSLGFWLAQTQELYDRAYTIHTTYISFKEYSYLLRIDDIDEYIRYGGTLLPGELAFDDPDAMMFDAAFRDDETTRRYIDTAICENIQHSLACCRQGNYLRHLRDLYEAGELTSAINRIIESMNHQFLLSVLTKPFKSHDLGSAAQQLRKQIDAEKRTRILDRIDRETVTNKLMELLKIRNREDAKVGIREEHVQEIRQYLQALDLVVECPRETMEEPAEDYVLFTQPGMRYCQAQTLVHVLMNAARFQSFPERERELACEKILEDVRGRMLEDIVLLETVRSLPKQQRAFKLTLPRSELDMVIYHEEDGTCEGYEIKHSKEIVPRQYHVLEDGTLCQMIEQKYGPMRRRCVIYRGESRTLDNGIIYLNAEEYLQGL